MKRVCQTGTPSLFLVIKFFRKKFGVFEYCYYLCSEKQSNKYE